ncbi:type IV secretory system conjugative DNA transfer family protein [Clostridium estertheticum]|uniref:type IV secretory system conjugative DNA transfer family protein n=1 Tax=Clostridium estertheticum TaxID=238834 RepID=UPI001C0CD3C0|nr:type IV secretory system conjugative DNA transfer family protein [Clostridium estertheticum]MBU3173387.1 type IV secretory system conjugative DNA transfer family protein [Clostridium estertheticum]
MEILAMGSSLCKLAAIGIGLDAVMKGYKSFSKVSKTATAYKAKPREIKNFVGKDGITLSKHIQISEKTTYEHIGVFGKTGSRKTTGLYLPNLLSNNLPQKSSLVISDIKGELHQKTSWYQKNVCKREIIVFAPLNPEFSCSINPLDICQDMTDIRKLAQTLLANSDKSSPDKSSGGAEWQSMSTPLLSASLAYCKYKGGEQCSITTALDIVINNSNEELELLFRDSTIEIMGQWNIFKTALNVKGVEGSIKITLASALQIFLDYKISSTTSKCDFRPEYLRQRPIALYIIYPSEKADYLAPLMATIFSQLTDVNLEYYDKHIESLPIFNFYDEFANIGFIASFNHIITTARSKKFALILCIHDVRQLYRLYGEDLTYTMLNNLTTKIVLPGISEPATIKFISELCGDTEITVSNQSKTGDKTTVNTSKQTRKLYTPSEVRCLADNTCVVIINNKQPVADKLNLCYENPLYDNRIVNQYL